MKADQCIRIYGVILKNKRNAELRDRLIKATKEEIKKAYSSEEYALMQAINAYIETTRSYNLMYERLGEWFGIYFPEIRIGTPKTLSELVLLLSDRQNINQERIGALIKEKDKAESIYLKASSTMGRELSGDEKEPVVNFARLCMETEKSIAALDAYIQIASNRLMPNLTYLTDDKIAAEMLSKAGSLERLALMPSSTIQLLGAEKALFKHIKFGSKPPKYGVLFKLPAVGTAPRHMRGRIARAYATKISIGLKGDVFSKRFIGEELKSSLDASLERIRSSPEPEPRQHTHEYQRRPMGGRHGFGGGRRPRGRERHGPPRRPGA